MSIKKLLFLSLSFLSIWLSFASVPDYYFANYEIQSDWDKITEIFVNIEASNKIGQEISQDVFSNLNLHFNKVFSKFPQDYNFKVVYKQCLETTNTLSQENNTMNLSIFMDNCYSPLEDILKKIENNYTVTANVKTYPQTGPAPLTVTLDARNSVDPSNETIPDDNFFWYYRDNDGNDKTIGVWPVINTVFDEPWNYIVHLTVRSSNYNTQWIFDKEKTFSIDVTPKSAVISAYANSKQLTKDQKIKLWSYEAKKWVVLDWSSTIAMWGRTILWHKWEISWPNFRYTKEGDGKPWLIKISLPEDWEYKIRISTNDNEGHTISETYYLLVSDPVAIIKTRPEKGTTSTSFSFDGSTSYSVVSSLRLYTWELFDENGGKIDTIQGKTIQKQITTPGSYTLKLTVEDSLGQENIDTRQIYVESTSPIAQYSITPTRTWKQPSEFILDASLTSDIDELNGIDDLSFTRSFSDPKFVNILSTESNNEIVTVSFDKVWTHTVKLIVEDQYGKIWEIEKEINITSILRPKFTATPKATPRWDPILLHASSNQEIISYEWNFWDGENRIIESPDISHTYEKNGVYTITMKAYGANGQENEISDRVFIGDKNSPIASYIVKNNLSQIIRESDLCTITTENGVEEVAAYKIDRYENITIDPQSSLNAKWGHTNIIYYFRPKNSEFYKTSQFKHKFNELGCQYVDLNVEDTDINRQDTQRIWFKVYNALPKLNNLLISFPQYGNELWIGFQENYVKDIFNSEFDQLMVRVDAQNSLDSDWFISYFKRYYYDKNDPDRLLETKITPGDIPYAFFSLPKVAGEFMFWVTLYDNDEGKQSSEDFLGNWPIVFFPPDTKRPDIPLVTLKVNKTTVNVWEEVTFDVISKIISENADFEKERTFEYDFDWDGEVDLLTKNDHVIYTYKEPIEEGITPRVSVLYRWYRWVGKWARIIIKEWFLPSILFDTIGKFSIFRETSIGKIVEKNICLDIVSCKKDIPWYSLNITDKKYFSYTYPNYWDFYISLYVKDKYANEWSKNWPISIKRNLNKPTIPYDVHKEYTWDLYILSIPSTESNSSGNYETFVGKNLDNTILYYILYNEALWDVCYVDLDITDTIDKDFECNTLFMKEFSPRYNSLIGKIYYKSSWEIITKEIKTSFLDFDINLDEDTQIIYNQINSIIDSIDNNEKANESLLLLLINLRNNIIDKNQTRANVVALSEFLSKDQTNTISDKKKEDINSIITYLSDSTTISSLGWNEYEQAKSEILLILPLALKQEIQALFMSFEQATIDTNENSSQQEKRKLILNQIISKISLYIVWDGEVQWNDNITKVDMESIVMPNVCKIIDFYDIVSEQCISDTTKIKDGSTVAIDNNSTWLSGWLKTILIILWVVVWIFVALIIVFAIKARVKTKEE